MEENKDILNHFKKRKKPTVPEGFFEQFYDELMAKIAEKESGLDAFQKSSPPDVPADFFENFAKKIPAKTPSDNTNQRTQVFNLKVIGVIASAAACLLIMFQLIQFDQTEVETPSASTNEQTIYTEEDLLAFVDEDDIVNYIIEEDVELSNEIMIDDLVGEDDSNQKEKTNQTTTDTSSDTDLDELNDEDILYYLEDDLDDINLDDLEL